MPKSKRTTSTTPPKSPEEVLAWATSLQEYDLLQNDILLCRDTCRAALEQAEEEISQHMSAWEAAKAQSKEEGHTFLRGLRNGPGPASLTAYTLKEACVLYLWRRWETVWLKPGCFAPPKPSTARRPTGAGNIHTILKGAVERGSWDEVCIEHVRSLVVTDVWGELYTVKEGVITPDNLLYTAFASAPQTIEDDLMTRIFDKPYLGVRDLEHKAIVLHLGPGTTKANYDAQAAALWARAAPAIEANRRGGNHTNYVRHVALANGFHRFCADPHRKGNPKPYAYKQALARGWSPLPTTWTDKEITAHGIDVAVDAALEWLAPRPKAPPLADLLSACDFDHAGHTSDAPGSARHNAN